MSWVAVCSNNVELVFYEKPERVYQGCFWSFSANTSCIHKQAVRLPKGSIKKLIGRDLTWEDEAVELKEGNYV